MPEWHAWTNNQMEYHHGFLMWSLLEAQNSLNGFLPSTWCLLYVWVTWLRKHHVISSGGNIKLGPKQLAPFILECNYCSFHNFTHTILNQILRKGYKMNPISSCRNQLGRYIKLGKSLSDLDQYIPETLQDWSKHVKEWQSFRFWFVFVFGKLLTSSLLSGPGWEVQGLESFDSFRKPT